MDVTTEEAEAGLTAEADEVEAVDATLEEEIKEGVEDLEVQKERGQTAPSLPSPTAMLLRLTHPSTSPRTNGVR